MVVWMLLWHWPWVFVVCVVGHFTFLFLQNESSEGRASEISNKDEVTTSRSLYRRAQDKSNAATQNSAVSLRNVNMWNSSNFDYVYTKRQKTKKNNIYKKEPEKPRSIEETGVKQCIQFLKVCLSVCLLCVVYMCGCVCNKCVCNGAYRCIIYWFNNLSMLKLGFQTHQPRISSRNNPNILIWFKKKTKGYIA